MSNNRCFKGVKGKQKARRADEQPREELQPGSSTTTMSLNTPSGLQPRLNILFCLRKKRGAKDNHRQQHVNTEQVEQQEHHRDTEAGVEEQTPLGPSLPAEPSVRQPNRQQRRKPNIAALVDEDHGASKVVFVPEDQRRYARNWEDLSSDLEKRLLETSADGNTLSEWDYLRRVATMHQDRTEHRGEKSEGDSGRDPAAT